MTARCSRFGTWVARLVSLLALTMGVCPAARTETTQPLEAIRISPDAKGFVLSPSGAPFIPYGFNYAPRNEMLEDHWDTHWPEIEQDFREMRDLGANVVRLHLQFPAFMEAADRPSSHALQRLRDFLRLAEETHLYLDVTGLACYEPGAAPAWYDQLDEKARWDVQANFWSAVASTCTTSPAVFCYDLINEPLSPGEKRKPGEWYSGSNFGGFDFLQYIALDPAGRPRDQIARDWIRHLTAAIRKEDKHHLITVGLLPWEEKWGHLSGFIPETVAPELDFVSVHIYPEKGRIDAALEGLRKFAVGKPLVIEETFPLNCSTAELREFLIKSRPPAGGWIGHYFGESEQELRAAEEKKTITISQKIMLDWLQLFREVRPHLVTTYTD